MGIASSFTMFGNLIGPLSSGFIASVTSIDFMFILSGIVLASSSLFAYFSLKEIAPQQSIKQKDKSLIKEEIAAGLYE